MRKFALFAALAACVAAPAQAAGEGRAEIQLGYDSIDGESGVTYGGVLGYDMDFGASTFLGAEIGVSDSTADSVGIEASRELSASARFGVKLGERAKAYTLVGYSNQRFTAAGLGSENLDGIRFGAGAQLDLSKSLYTKVEYRYTNYEQGVERHTAVAGMGVKF